MITSRNQSRAVESLTDKNNEAGILLGGTLVEDHLLIRVGEGGVVRGAGVAGGVGEKTPSVGHPPPETETPPEPR